MKKSAVADSNVLSFKKKQIAAYLEENPDATFDIIFQFIPRTPFAIDTGLHKGRVAAKIENPELFKVKEILSIAAYLEVTPERILKLIVASIPRKNKK